MTIELRGKVNAGACSVCGARGRVVLAYDGRQLCGGCCVDESARFDLEGTWPRPAWEWPVVPELAVLTVTGGRLGLITGDSGQWWRPLNAANTYDRAWFDRLQLFGVHEVWIHDKALAAMGWPLDGDWPAWESHKGMTIVVPRYEGGTSPRDGQYRNSSPWWGLDDVDLYVQLCAFAGAVGHRWVRSGAITSDTLIWDRWGGRIDHAELPPIDDIGRASLELPDTRAGHVGAGVHYAGERSTWVYGFDLNANYLGAASNLTLSSGAPREVGLVDAKSITNPGYWTSDQREWFTTPTAIARGGQVQGWSYPDHRQWLQPWYKTLRDARAALVPGAALEAVKATYRAGIGRLISTRRGDSDIARRLYQPYWQQAVVANARERLRRRIEAMPRPPMAVDTDAVFFYSNRRDARVLALELGLELGAGLGQWHVIGRAYAKQAAAIMANENEIAAVRELRAIVRGENQ